MARVYVTEAKPADTSHCTWFNVSDKKEKKPPCCMDPLYLSCPTDQYTYLYRTLTSARPKGARFTEPERSEGSAFFAHVFAASGSREARTRAGKRWKDGATYMAVPPMPCSNV